MVDYHNAIRALHPEVVRVEEDNDSITAYDADNNIVTWNKVAVDAWVDPQAYQYQRQQAYEPIEEQLDMLYWDKINGTNNWETMITTVKNLYPKPTE